MEELLGLNCHDVEDRELSQENIDGFLDELSDWQMVDDTTIAKTVTFDTFAEAIEYVNSVAPIAESEAHHPDIDIRYDTVLLKLTTHDVGELTLCDFIVAAKINALS